MSRLPIFDLHDQLLSALKPEQARVLIEAPTGSGKSTQVPSMLADSPSCQQGEILVLQPRRMAARMLADRVAAERGGKTGDEVGYQVRFERQVSAATRIRFITEGILMRQLMESPDLRGVAAIVFDEFHERHYFSDISLARCIQVQETNRPDLRLVVMSATLESASLLAYLGDATSHLVSDGRTYPVTIRYQASKERHKDELWDHVVRALRDHFAKQPPNGHVLVFMPGRYEIQKTVAALSRATWAKGWEIHELHGEQAPSAQDAAVRPGARPRIIVATNVAETSITIDGVTLVVDSGLERRSSFDHRRGIPTLHIEPISRASADQRAGRAGRTAPGTAIRLWSERAHEQREMAAPAEIHRMDLTEVILLLKATGVDDLASFPWFDPPPPELLHKACLELQKLGALDESLELTPIGKSISAVPAAPKYARVLFEAAQYQQADTFAVILALIQSRSLFPLRKKQPEHLMPEDFSHPDDYSDFQPLLRAWDQMRQNQFDLDLGRRLGIHVGACRDVARVATQLARIATRWTRKENRSGESIPPPSTEDEASIFARILLAGFSSHLAVRNSPTSLACSVVDQRKGQLEKSSIGAAPRTRLLLAAEIVEVEGRDMQVKLNLTTRISEPVLQRTFPQDFRQTSGACYDETQRRVDARVETRFRDLVLESKPGGPIDAGQAASLLADHVESGELVLKHWDEKIEAYFNRVNLVAEHCPEYGTSRIDADARRLIREQVCLGATSYKEIKDRQVWPSIKEYLPAHERDIIERLAPDTVKLSNGRSANVQYRSGEKPRISVLIQHLFGLADSPTICADRVPVVIEVLAPNHRPVQVTEKLSAFWTGSYPAVRAQLRGRYPKHAWPEF